MSDDRKYGPGDISAGDLQQFMNFFFSKAVGGTPAEWLRAANDKVVMAAVKDVCRRAGGLKIRYGISGVHTPAQSLKEFLLVPFGEAAAGVREGGGSSPGGDVLLKRAVTFEDGVGEEKLISIPGNSAGWWDCYAVYGRSEADLADKLRQLGLVQARLRESLFFLTEREKQGTAMSLGLPVDGPCVPLDCGRGIFHKGLWPAPSSVFMSRESAEVGPNSPRYVIAREPLQYGPESD